MSGRIRIWFVVVEKETKELKISARVIGRCYHVWCIVNFRKEVEDDQSSADS